MLEKIREKLLAFIASDKDVPLLAGFSIGFYMMLFYYSKNFALANSLEQILFFTGYYIIMPMLVLFGGYKLLSLTKLATYKRHFLFIGMIGFLAFFLLQLNHIGFSKKIIFGVILLVALILSYWGNRYYKLIIILLFLISVFNVKPIAGVVYKAIISTDEWKKIPDDIETATFKQKPNIYYIQPDGYTSFKNLNENPLYNFDNSDYENFLEENGFKRYENYRSNYYSTLLSNSATFSMKHHYVQRDVDTYGARGIIVGDNPVLRILKSNGYKTSFITENPYLLMNRYPLAYNFCNIRHDEIPYLRDGFSSSTEKDVFNDLKNAMKGNKSSSNFYFVEKFLPGHIPTFKADSEGVDKEREKYLAEVRKANVWLKEVVKYIVDKDPEAIVIIGADHGGFCGYAYTHESLKKTTNKDLIYSIFGAQLAIKWNNEMAVDYDKDLKSGVNLFRTVFSFLAKDQKYLNNQEENGSYVSLKEPVGVYEYIDENGKIVFREK